MTNTAIILAAGVGTGLKPLTYEIPKCLTEINGKPVLENTLEILEKNNFKRVIIVIGYLGELVVEKFGDKFGDLEITYLINSKYKNTGAAYSLWLARKYMDCSFLIIESDTIFKEEVLRKLLNFNENHSYWVGSKFLDKHIGCRLTIDKKNRIIDLNILNDVNEEKSNSYFKSVGLLKINKDFGFKLKKVLDRYIIDNQQDYYGLPIKELLNTESLLICDIEKSAWSELDTFNDIHEAEKLFQKMKYIIMIPDGMADLPILKLNNKTPLEVASTPNMDFLTRNGTTGLVQTMFKGLPVGSIVAIMGILGYNPARYYPVGRASFEAIAQKIHLGDNDIVFRCNLISVKEGKISDFTSSMISNDEALGIVNNLKISNKNIEIYAGQSYRNLLVVRDANISARDIISHEPHSNINQSIDGIMLSSKNSAAKDLISELNDLLYDSLKQIKEINKKLNTKADMIWLWSPSVPPKLPSFFSKYNINGAIVAGLDFLRGLGEASRMESKEIRGATGYFDTNLKEKLKYAKNFLRNNDFLMVHYNATDEESHALNIDNKIKAIENFDEQIVGPLLEHLNDNYPDNYRIAIMPDHYTLSTNGQHLDTPVPYIMYGDGIPKDDIDKYIEKNISSDSIIKNYELIDKFKAKNFV